MPRTGRPTKLTKEVQDKVALAVGLGAPYELAALYAGLDRTTVWDWLKKGENQTEGPFREFSNAVKKAEGDGVVGCLASVRKAGQQQWQAAAWWLERKFPESFALRRDTNVTVNNYSQPKPLEIPWKQAQ